MKHLVKRWIAMFLCLMLIFGILPGAVTAAEVEYVVKNGYILNWGSRGTAATFLPPNAETFYEENQVTYEDLALLDGTSDVAGVPESELYLALQQLMASNHSHKTSYEETKGLYRYTDCQNSDDSSISSFYSGLAVGPEWNSKWNREHTWPNSKGLGGNDENDIMMLRPTSVSENSGRSNTAYGESGGYYDPNSESGGTYNLHGDVARIMLYTYVRWGNTDLMWGSGGVMESKEVLLKWMKEDPVDTWELGRNDSVQSITGTRNVFVDYPELAFLMFGEAVPADMVTPSGEAADSGDYTITAMTSDPARGQIVMDGRVITAEAEEGCRIAGFTVVSGEAVVTQKGNVFTVYPLSDCTVRIDFKTIDAATVTFMENGTAASAESVYTGERVTLPSHSGQVPEGFSFVGWVLGEVDETDEIPAEVYPVGSSLAVEAEMTIHALYSRVDKNAQGSSNVFEPFSGSIEEGDYLIVSDDAAMKAADLNGRLSFVDVTYINETIKGPDELLIWHIAPTSDGYYTIYNEAAGKYAASTGKKNKAELISSVTDASKWTPSEADEGRYEFVNLANANKGINANLRKNGLYGFACYGLQTGGPSDLYKRVSGVIYYSTSAVLPEIVVRPGDVNLDGYVNVDDVLTLLWHVLFPEEYRIEVDGNFDGVGETNVDDVLALLWHVLFPEEYPLS